MSNNPTKESSRSSVSDPKADKSLGIVKAPENVIEQHSLSQAKPTPEQRYERIAVVAYRLAESRGFGPGGELEDWLRAEAEVDGPSE